MKLKVANILGHTTDNILLFLLLPGLIVPQSEGIPFIKK